MFKHIDILKGVHPGKLIERDLRKAGITQRTLAVETGIPYQTINAVLSGRRNLTLRQALKVESFMGYEEGFLSVLQAFHAVRLLKEADLANKYPDKPNVRRILFWDIDFDRINWGLHKDAVVRRVLERGNQEEAEEILRFYKLGESERKTYQSLNRHVISNRHGLAR